jgi:VanZ family protein
MSSAPFLLQPSYPAAALPVERGNSPLPGLLSAWLPALLFALVFAVESTPTFGADRTSAPVHDLLRSLLSAHQGIVLDAHWSELHHLLRKTGHFLAYGAFSLVAFQGLRQTLRSLSLRGIIQGMTRKWTQLASHGLAVFTAFLIANADEIHQTFLPNRTGCFSDVVLDTSGAIAFQLALAGVLHLVAQYRKTSSTGSFILLNIRAAA